MEDRTDASIRTESCAEEQAQALRNISSIDPNHSKAQTAAEFSEGRPEKDHVEKNSDERKEMVKEDACTANLVEEDKDRVDQIDEENQFDTEEGKKDNDLRKADVEHKAAVGENESLIAKGSEFPNSSVRTDRCKSKCSEFKPLSQVSSDLSSHERIGKEEKVQKAVLETDKKAASSSTTGKTTIPLKGEKRKEDQAAEERIKKRKKMENYNRSNMPTKDELEWTLKRLFSVICQSPIDVMVIVRNLAFLLISPELSEKTEQYPGLSRQKQWSEITPGLKDLDNANALLRQESGRTEIQLILRYAHLANTASAKSGEVENYTKQHHLTKAVKLGERINLLAYAISPRNGFGYLALRAMNLTAAYIATIPQGCLEAMVQVLLCSDPAARYRVRPDIAHIADYTIRFLLPAIE